MAEKKINTELKTSKMGRAETLLQNMMENMQLIAVTLDMQANITFCNDHFLDITGWQRKDVINANWFEMFIKSADKKVYKIFRDALASGKIISHYENIIFTKSGSKRLVKWSNTLLRGENGEIIGTASIGEDITEKKQAEERLRVFFHQSLDGFFFCHFDKPREWQNAKNKETILEDIINTQRFSDVNDAMLKQYNISRKKFLSLTTKDIFAHDLEQGRKLRRELFDNGRLHLETYERMTDGTPVWFEGDYVCLYDETKRVTGFFGIQRDITDRKQSEIALYKAEEKYRGIFENAMEGIYQSSAAGRFITINPAFARMLGYNSPEEIIASITDIASQIYGETSRREDFVKILERDGSITGFEYQMRRKDSSVICVSENARVVRNAEGKVDYYEGIVEDVTARKNVEEQLLLQSAALNAAANAIMISDKNGNIEWVNPAYLKISGYSAGEVIGNNPRILKSEAHDREFFKNIWDTILDGQVWHGEVVNKSKDGNSYIVEETITPILNAENNPVHFIGITQDITERKQNEQHIDKQLKRLNALHAIDNAITSSTDLRTTLDVLLKEVITQLKADAAAVLLFNKNTLTLDYTAGRGFKSKSVPRTKLKHGQGFAGRVILDRKTIHIPDLRKTESSLTESLSVANENFSAYVGAPLIAKGQILGVLEIFQHAPLSPDTDWFDFLDMLAGQTAIAIDNAQLFENLQRSNFELTLAYDATIEGWSRALDLRDKETEGHTQRVTTLTMQLAQQMGIPSSEMLHIRRGALLHDIGKMGIPDNILHKPASLTKDEWEIMHRHTIYATEMLTPIPYLRFALDIPRHHHEKWNGTGYPHGLRGNEIPLPARIFAVVDVWDAVTSDRPYRTAWTKDKAINYIKSESDKHFDPNVVNAFLRLIEA